MTGPGRSTTSSAIVAACALLAAAYANHFSNAFHFDDGHTIVENPYVRSLRFVPRYFVDATTFSVLPLNQTYRPVLQSTFAVDYRAAGYDVRAYHVDSFAWFIVFLAAFLMLARALLGRAPVAVAATAIFALHPAIADTVNYIVQRGEILAALGVVGGLALYVTRPRLRATGVYLLPVMAGLLAKQTAAAFPLLLVAYLWIYEGRIGMRDAIVSTAATAIAGVWIWSRTPSTAAYASETPVRYVLTEPFIALRYFGTFFAPVTLTADPGWPVVSGVGDPALYVGTAFAIVIAAVVWTLRRSVSGRPVAFGLAWFLLAQAPTALVRLTEVGNDWRMFLPFVGLAIAAAAAADLVAQPFRAASGAGLKACATIVVLVLLAEAVGVHARNEVWRTDETLWRDATEKSPSNPRAWMNYGVALMARGDYAGAVDACERALPLAPDYALLRVNLGVSYGGVGRAADAEHEFLAARRLAPDDWRTHLYYGRWLASQGRAAEARDEVDRARTLNPVAMANQ
jgi:hypothetical protein